MKILITGAKGQLGYHLQQTFASDELFLGDVDNYDITKRDLVMRETEKFHPDVLIHAAAWTNVDGAEQNKELCKAINVDGTRIVAEAAKAVDATLVHISTDYVFAGDKNTPYLETDQPNSKSFYGQTKQEAEAIAAQATLKHFVCRPAWLYGGPKPTRGMDFTTTPFKNFVYTMLRVGKEKKEIEVVNDQIGGPTYASDVAETIKLLLGTIQYGIYHVTNSGQTSWADFAKEIFRLARYDTVVKPITTTEWETKNPQATKRPAYSVLGHQHLIDVGLQDTRDWKEALADFLGKMSNI